MQGNEINLACMQGWIKNHPDDASFDKKEGVALLQKMVDENKIGRKTGQGFYQWDGNKKLD